MKQAFTDYDFSFWKPKVSITSQHDHVFGYKLINAFKMCGYWVLSNNESVITHGEKNPILINIDQTKY